MISMSLCIAMNNPGKFTIMAGDGRVVLNGNSKIIKDDQRKITQLTDHVVMFSSGVEYLAEELRSIVERKTYPNITINEMTEIVQCESLRLHKELLRKHPWYSDELLKGHTSIATLLGYYDINTNTCGYIEYSHINNFKPMFYNGSSLKTRGIGQDYALEILLDNHSRGMEPVSNILNAYKLTSLKESKVGGNIVVCIINDKGTVELGFDKEEILQ